MITSTVSTTLCKHYYYKHKTTLDSAYTNNEINSEKITKPICVFQLSLGGNEILTEKHKNLTEVS